MKITILAYLDAGAEVPDVAIEQVQQALEGLQQLRRDGQPIARNTLRIGKVISCIGAAAGVITDPDKGQTTTSHDLRRGFGSRWAKLVMPATLKDLMRHASIETTMTYYVQQAARVTSSELWAARGTNLGTSRTDKARERQKTQRK